MQTYESRLNRLERDGEPAFVLHFPSAMAHLDIFVAYLSGNGYNYSKDGTIFRKQPGRAYASPPAKGCSTERISMEPKVKYTDSARYKCLEYLKQHSVELYLVYCGQEICDCGHSYGPAERQEYLLHYVVSGKGEFQAGERKYQLKSQDAFLIFPDEVTYYQADSKEPWTYIWIAFNGSKALECIHYAGFSDEKRVNSFSCGDTLIQC